MGASASRVAPEPSSTAALGRSVAAWDAFEHAIASGNVVALARLVGGGTAGDRARLATARVSAVAWRSRRHGGTLLHEALRWHAMVGKGATRARMLTLLLDAGVSVAAVDSSGCTALLLAVTLRLPLAEWADVMLPAAAAAAPACVSVGCAAWRQTPLHVACWNGDIAAAMRLMAAGADVNASAVEGWLPIHALVAGPRRPVIPVLAAAVDQLVARGASVNAAGKDGLTPLHIAQSDADVKLLWSRGAQLSCAAATAGTPLVYAIATRRASVAAALLAVATAVDVNACDAAGRTPLHHAVVHAGTPAVAALATRLACHPAVDVNRPAADGALALVQALWNHHVALATAILSRTEGTRVSVNALDGQLGLTAVHAAVATGNLVGLAAQLTAAGADWGAVTREGSTVVHLAVVYSRTDAETYTTLARLTNINGTTTSSNSGQRTALHWASELNRVPCVTALLAAGANLHARDSHGMTPLHVAAFYGSADAMDALKAAGACITATTDDRSTILHEVARNKTRGAALVRKVVSWGVAVNAVNRSGRTALHTAVENTLPAAAIEALLAAGASPDVEDTASHFTPLMMAAQWDNRPALSAMLAMRPLPRLRAAGPHRLAPLLIAAHHGKVECCRMLLAAGADVNEAATSGRTALLAAAANHHPHVVSLLLNEAGAAVSGLGDRPLHVAAAAGMPSLVARLLAGAPTDKLALVGQLDSRRFTPLMALAAVPTDPEGRCSQEDPSSVVDMLLTAGAAPPLEVPGYSVTSPSSTSLHLAAGSGHDWLCRQLLDRGWSPLAVDTAGQTPLACACRHGRTAAMRILLPVSDLAAVDAVGCTLLHLAVETNSADAITLLLDALREPGPARGCDGDVVVVADEGGAPDSHPSDRRHMLLALDSAEGTVLHRLAQRATPPDGGALQAVLHHLADDRSLLSRCLAARSPTQRTPLHVAAAHGHATTVRRLLQAGADAGALTGPGDGRSPFALAVAGEHWAAASELLPVCSVAEGGVVDALLSMKPGKPDGAALFRAALTRQPAAFVAAGALEAALHHDRCDVVEMLLASPGAVDVTACLSDGATLLHVAARLGRGMSVLTALVSAGVPKDAEDGAGHTALHDAVEMKHPGTAAALLQLGCAVTFHPDRDGVLQAAARGRRMTLLEAALRHPIMESAEACTAALQHLLLGLGTTTPMDAAAVPRVDAMGATLLNRGAALTAVPRLFIQCALHGLVCTLHAAAAAGATVPLPDGDDDTPLHVATSPAIASALIRAGASVNARGAGGRTPLMALAARPPGSCVLTMAVLTGAGARAADVDDDGHTALLVYLLGRVGARSVADAITVADCQALTQGCEGEALASLLRTTSVDGDSPLHLAARIACAPLAVWFVSAGADLMGANSVGVRPLNVAARHPHVLQALVDAAPRADLVTEALNTTDGDGNTPLHTLVAQPHGRDGGRTVATLVQVLVTRCGARVDARNAAGELPLHAAASQRNPCFDAMQILADRTEDVDAGDAEGCTPLMRLLRHADNAASSVLVLRWNGASRGTADHRGRNAYHYVAARPSTWTLDAVLRVSRFLQPPTGTRAGADTFATSRCTHSDRTRKPVVLLFCHGRPPPGPPPPTPAAFDAATTPSCHPAPLFPVHLAACGMRHPTAPPPPSPQTEAGGNVSPAHINHRDAAGVTPTHALFQVADPERSTLAEFLDVGGRWDVPTDNGACALSLAASRAQPDWTLMQTLLSRHPWDQAGRATSTYASGAASALATLIATADAVRWEGTDPYFQPAEWPVRQRWGLRRGAALHYAALHSVGVAAWARRRTAVVTDHIQRLGVPTEQLPPPSPRTPRVTRPGDEEARGRRGGGGRRHHIRHPPPFHLPMRQSPTRGTTCPAPSCDAGPAPSCDAGPAPSCDAGPAPSCDAGPAPSCEVGRARVAGYIGCEGGGAG
jgi:ankyrin repeat protein